MNIPASPIILNNLTYLVDHYFNGTKISSWKFDQMYKVMYNREIVYTEEELIFECLIYIYENFVSYAFKYDVNNCMKLLKFTLENNKRSRSKYRRISILEKFAKGYIIRDKEIINIMIEQIEKLIEYCLDRMYPIESRGQIHVALGLKSEPWIKLDKPVKIINPFIDQVPGYAVGG